MPINTNGHTPRFPNVTPYGGSTRMWPLWGDSDAQGATNIVRNS
jgi:hypothetical protein